MYNPGSGTPWQVPGARTPGRPQAPPASAAGGGGAFWSGPNRSRGSYNAESAGSDGAAPGWATDTIRNRYTDAMNRSGGQAEQAEDLFMQKAGGFDAMGYVNQASQGAFNQFLPQLRQDLGDLRGEQVGMGRLDSGFGTEDEDRLITTGMDRLSDTVARYSMQGAGLDQENTRMIGGYGEEQGNRYLDLIAGQYDRKTAEQNAKKKGGFGWDDLGGVVGGALSFI